jgi:hypothetical protein
MAISLPFEAGRRIAIVGKAPSSLGLAPYHDATWQIWTLSDLVLCKQAPRYDVQFELHDWELVKQRGPYYEWLCNAQHKPLCVQKPQPELTGPGVFTYPLAEIVEQYGGYFTNTVSYLIALAIATGPDEIGVWGVDMAQSDEYRAQRPSCEYFLGMAVGRGIKITVPAQCDLLKTAGLYGFDPKVSDLCAKLKARSQELAHRIAECNQLAEAKAHEAAFLAGAKDNNDLYMSQWGYGTGMD